MTLRRLLFRAVVPLSVFAVLATLMVSHGISSASDGQGDEQASAGTPAVVRDRAVPVMPKAEREPAPPRTSKDDAGEDDLAAAADTVVAQLPATKVAKFSLLGVTWREGLVDADTAVEVRWRGNDGWSDWTELHVEPSNEGTPGTEPYWVGSADAAAVRVLSTSDAAPRGLELATIDPGKMPTSSGLRTVSGSVSRPTIISRAAWGANNSGTCSSPIYGSSLRGAVIHHTAGSNTEPADRSAAVVKATQAYHMNSRDWCDIAYNFLVDRYGQIFEGRKGGIDKVVRGAHSGNGSVNEQTTGIALMGTFTTAAPTTAMKSALVRLTAWKLNLHGVPAKGTYSLGGKTLNRIAGHRNVVSTECPGATVYSWLTSTSSTGLRTQVADAIAAGAVTAERPATVALPTVKAGYHSARVYWTAVPNATTYDVCLMADKTQTSCSRLVTGVTELTTYLQDLKPTADTDWYVKVRALDNGVKGYWSSLRGFNLQTATGNTVTVPSSREITVLGHGYGHGIGMSQYGAQGAAKQGVTYASILSRYYPGTTLGERSGNIRVLISQDTTDPVEIAGRSGLVFRNVAARTTVTLPTLIGGDTVTRWRILQVTSDMRQSTLQYKTTGDYKSYNATRWTGDGQFEGPSSIGLIMPDGATLKYRGAIRSAVPSAGSTSRNTVNVVSIENYVRGVIAAEMPSSWMPEALKSQAVAARTYGVRSITSSRYYDICSTTSCQVYGGASRETTNTDSAVAATARKVLMHDGKPAFTQFSSSSGGYTAPGSQTYLKAVSDPWDNWTGNANHAWSTTVSASTIENAHPTIGTLKQLTVTKRNGYGDWGGRVTSVSLVGSKTTVTISGDSARWSFGLKSNWFRF